jgi:hypothetical protein
LLIFDLLDRLSLCHSPTLAYHPINPTIECRSIAI